VRYYVVIPAHNEEAFLEQTLISLVNQSLLPSKAIVVNDNSTDTTGSIISKFTQQYDFIEQLNIVSKGEHLPGSKVISAFNHGFAHLDSNFDFIVKLDADLELPKNYFEKIGFAFKSNPLIGIAGGFIYEEDSSGHWVKRHPMDKNHVRGAFKAYSQVCFKAIGGLRQAMGWDTLDELLAQYHGFKTYTDPTLEVRHLRPTGRAYSAKAKLLQGKAMYSMRYGPWITMIASCKMAVKQKKWAVFRDNLFGYLVAKKQGMPYLVSKKEGEFIRQLRWRNIKKKILP
jgi:glycosyltransferase involved in cell wall biosynthesis